MKLEILFPGSSAKVPPYFSAVYSTPCLLTANDRKILIDPGELSCVFALEKELENRNIKSEEITDIFLTHFHLDHGYNTKLFTNATVYIHGAYKNKPYEKFGTLQSKLFLEVINSWKNVVEINDGDVFFDSIKVFYSPWHSKEHCSFVIETENMGKVLYAGDIVMNKVEFYDIIRLLRNDDCSEFVNNLVKDVDWIVFTHDEPLNVKEL